MGEDYILFAGCFQPGGAGKRRDEEVSPVAMAEQAGAVYEYDPKLWLRILTHRGKWVAVDDPHDPKSRLSIGDSPAEALRKAAKRGVTHPTLVRVPEAGSSQLL